MQQQRARRGLLVRRLARATAAATASSRSSPNSEQSNGTSVAAAANPGAGRTAPHNGWRRPGAGGRCPADRPAARCDRLAAANSTCRRASRMAGPWPISRSARYRAAASWRKRRTCSCKAIGLGRPVRQSVASPSAEPAASAASTMATIPSKSSPPTPKGRKRARRSTERAVFGQAARPWPWDLAARDLRRRAESGGDGVGADDRGAGMVRAPPAQKPFGRRCPATPDTPD